METNSSSLTQPSFKITFFPPFFEAKMFPFFKSKSVTRWSSSIPAQTPSELSGLIAQARTPFLTGPLKV